MSAVPGARHLLRPVRLGADQYGALFNDGLPARMEQKRPKTCTAPARELETRVKHGLFRHDGNTCLRWQASNVVVTRGTDDSLRAEERGGDVAEQDRRDRRAPLGDRRLAAPGRGTQLFGLGGVDEAPTAAGRRPMPSMTSRCTSGVTLAAKQYDDRLQAGDARGCQPCAEVIRRAGSPDIKMLKTPTG